MASVERTLARQIVATIAARRNPPSPPDFWTYLAHVRIESDPDITIGGGPIAFVPYHYQRERLECWLDGDSEWLLKPRQIGFSWLVAAYTYWRAAYHQASHVALFSKGELEVHQLLRKVSYIHRHLPEAVRAGGTITTEAAAFRNGSTITGYPATQAAGIGTTLALAVFDEAAFHPQFEANHAAVAPALGDFGQCIVLSTANPELGPAGAFHDGYQAAKQGESVYRAVFLPADIRPGRDEAWFARERLKFPGDEERFAAYYPFTDAEAFVGKSGLVFPQFSVQKHVRVGNPVAWQDCIARVACYDLGGGDPTAVVPLGLYRRSDGLRAIHQFGEMYKQTGAPTVDEIAGYLLRLHEQAPFDSIEPDPVGVASTVAASLYAMGLPVRGEMDQRGGFRPTPLTRDPGERRSIQAMYLENGLLTINSNCVHSIREFAGYRWKENIDPNSKDRYRIATPVDHHGDAMDARGGALVAVYYGEMNRGVAGGSRKVKTGRKMAESVRP